MITKYLAESPIDCNQIVNSGILILEIPFCKEKKRFLIT